MCVLFCGIEFISSEHRNHVSYNTNVNFVRGLLSRDILMNISSGTLKVSEHRNAMRRGKERFKMGEKVLERDTIKKNSGRVHRKKK